VFKELQAEFEKVRRIRPPATRKESFELYLLAKGFRKTS
jgi:23S rRNA U2552 (ribose-2'-O)-methylase RlmE/FtsJ